MPDESKTDPPNPAADSIGRPAPWQDGRHKKRDSPLQDSVLRKPGEGPAGTTSTKVTLDDYEQRRK